MFKIFMETGNAAFGENQAEEAEEVSRILKKLSQEVLRKESGKILDLNGNAIGVWKFTHESDMPF